MDEYDNKYQSTATHRMSKKKKHKNDEKHIIVQPIHLKLQKNEFIKHYNHKEYNWL